MYPPRGLILVLAVLLPLTASAGTVMFDPPIGSSIVETTFHQNLPGWTAAGDFNKDGILDVVVTSGGEEVHIMLGRSDGQGKGDGSFTQNGIWYAGENPGIGKVGDVDNDSNLDIVWSDNGNGRLTVVLGDGTGGLGPADRYPVFGGMRSVASRDLNGDASVDLIGSNCCSAAAYLLNNGVVAPGTFGQVQNLNEPGLAGNPARSYIEDADLNGDGEQDVVIGNQSPNISVLLSNSGDDGFTRSQLIDNVDSSANGLAVGDFDGDTIPDLAANSLVSGVHVFLGIGDGTFGPADTYQAGSCLPSLSTLQVAAADFDGDSFFSWKRGRVELPVQKHPVGWDVLQALAVSCVSPPWDPRQCRCPRRPAESLRPSLSASVDRTPSVGAHPL